MRLAPTGTKFMDVLFPNIWLHYHSINRPAQVSFVPSMAGH